MKLFKIEENDANQRLDKFLKKLFPNASRALIYKFNRKNKVKIKFDESEGKFKKRDNEYKLQVGDEVKIFLSDLDFKNLSEKKKESFSQVWGDSLNKEDIVFEDGDLLVINKNPGVNVHPGDFKTKEVSLIFQVQDYLSEKLNSLTFKPSLVHRIDRDTSWILLVAKKKNILTKLVSDFRDHSKIKKTYYALVFWKMSRTSGTITKKLLRLEGAKNENKVQVSEKWQTAISHYKLLQEHNIQTKEGNIVINEVEIEIETGRMHQIRVHLKSIWNPIVWDKNYGNKQLNAYVVKHFWLNRQALHAWKIEFFHYGRNKNMQLTARMKPDMQNFIKKLTS